MSIVICHYAEIALKSGNRAFFEEKLVDNIKKSLVQEGIVFNSVKRIFGRVLIELKPEGVEYSRLKALGVLRNVFGLADFSFAEKCEKDIEKIKEKAGEILSKKNFKTFKVEAKRSDKKFLLTSQQVNELVGAHILLTEKEGVKLLPKPLSEKLMVDLDKPDIVLFIEITEKAAFLYTEKIAGPGGLPVGVSGKAVCLISGGIDSPVAAWYLMKRGVKVIFAHFFANQPGYEKSLEKVRDILRVLNKFQFTSKVYFVPFSDIQKEIVLKCQADLRVVLYRRFMFRVSQEIAQEERAKALITGENIGQVASQTLDNILVIEEPTSLPVLRPLAGMDKTEIINIAKKIGTYEISILPHLDCCSMFVPKHPQTKANLKEARQQEKKLKIKKLINSALKHSTTENL